MTSSDKEQSGANPAEATDSNSTDALAEHMAREDFSGGAIITEGSVEVRLGLTLPSDWTPEIAALSERRHQSMPALIKGLLRAGLDDTGEVRTRDGVLRLADRIASDPDVNSIGLGRIVTIDRQDKGVSSATAR